MQFKSIVKSLCALVILVFIFSACKTTQYGYAVKDESKNISIRESHNVLDYASLQKQNVPTFASRGALGNRGLPLGSAISLATNAIKNMIAEDRKKYTANYTFAKTDLYFYDQLSTESPFDPVGLQFKGFTLVRTYVNDEGKTDTAFVARFVIDSSRSNEIINNSIFRLKVQDLAIYKTKAKITSGQKNSINMDIEITFSTSYVNNIGQLFNNTETGKFYLTLRDAPLDKNASNYKSFYDGLKGELLDGKSFIIPRSYGYFINAEGESKPCYSQGAYSIQVKVKESTKDKFITKMLIDNSSQIIDGVSGSAVKLVNAPKK